MLPLPIYMVNSGTSSYTVIYNYTCTHWYTNENNPVNSQKSKGNISNMFFVYENIRDTNLPTDGHEVLTRY